MSTGDRLYPDGVIAGLVGGKLKELPLSDRPATALTVRQELAARFMASLLAATNSDGKWNHHIDSAVNIANRAADELIITWEEK